MDFNAYDPSLLVIAARVDSQPPIPLVDEEISAVVNLLHGKLLKGEISHSKIVDEVSVHPYPVMWISGHGNTEGVLLTQEMLTVKELVPILNMGHTELLYLNTCESLDVALQIQDEIQIDFICNIKEVPDRDAYINGRNFAIQLSRGVGVSEAWFLSKPGDNKNFVYLAGRKSRMSPPQPEPERSTLQRQVERLLYLFEGDPKWPQSGILAKLVQFEADIEEYGKAIAFQRMALLLVGLTALITLIVVVILILRG